MPSESTSNTALDSLSPRGQTPRESALALIEREWPVFPTKGKAPLTSNGFHAATTDRETLEGWWKVWPFANVAVRTGSSSRLVVLDIDPRHGGFESLKILEAEIGPLRSLRVETGGGGLHIYLQHPGLAIRSRPFKEYPGIDIKADGGYVIAPGSIHPETDKPYSFIDPDAPIIPIPEALLAKLQDKQKPRDLKAISGQVVEGNRNTDLASRIGSMVRINMPEDVIRKAAHAINEELYAPNPLPKDEVDRTVDSITRYDPENPLLLKPWSDLGNGERFAYFFGDRARYLATAKNWYVYEGGVWAPDDALQVQQMAKETARRTQIAAANMPRDNANRDEYMRAALAMESGKAQREMIDAAKAELAIAEDEFDHARHSELLNVANGVVNLRTKELLPHDPSYYFRRQSLVAYHPGATSDIWDAMLNHAFGENDELKEFAQVTMGYSATGYTTAEAAFLAIGRAATGKSTFLDANGAALGSYTARVSAESFLASRYASGGSAASEDIARLDGVRLLISSEPDSGRKLRSGLFKWLIGGDTIVARGLYQSSKEFKPQFTPWFGANEWPATDSEDTGVWRRLHRITMDNVVPEDQRDPEIKRYLTDPEGGGPAVLAWIVAGAMRFLETGKLEVPAIVRRATEELREKNDPINDFIEDECEVGPGLRAPIKELWDRFDQWQYHQDHASVKKNAFGARLETKGYRAAKVGSVRYREGLALIPKQPKSASKNQLDGEVTGPYRGKD